LNSNQIRLLVVDADPSGEGYLRSKLEGIRGVEIVGIAHSQRMALNQVETTQPELLLVDLMLPGYRSIDLISQVSASHPDIRILALSPGDIPHDRVMMAIRAGALGFITRDTSHDEAAEAIKQVHQGEPWLPLEDTYTGGGPRHTYDRPTVSIFVDTWYFWSNFIRKIMGGDHRQVD
jgi:two-component system invasion response regulator UvrY